MMMNPFTIKGDIRLVQRRLFVDGDECYGTAMAEGRKFQIRLSGVGIETIDEFIDTALHELIHLWLFILVGSLAMKLSDAASHRIIDATVSTAVRHLKRELRNKRKRK